MYSAKVPANGCWFIGQVRRFLPEHYSAGLRMLSSDTHFLFQFFVLLLLCAIVVVINFDHAHETLTGNEIKEALS